ELTQIELPFDGDTVNVWLLSDSGHTIMIDCGNRAKDLEPHLPLGPFDLFITHPHRDHLGGLDRCRPLAKRIYAPSELGQTQQVSAGQTIQSGSWNVQVIALPGHHPEAVGYRIRKAHFDVFAVGDAIYARSIGGCAGASSYRDARDSLVSAWQHLTAGTLILPGHGPATKTSIELKENPFLRAWVGKN
ncbi:MAG: MBL fold metallo-hydrolase, partial [Verrucomicrobiales bacterium]